MKYDDIINIKYPYQFKHPRMNISQRAAIFAPFAALSGYSEALIETSRLTEEKIVMDDSMKNIINEKLNIINHNIKQHPYISITYFVKDKYKKGGNYKTISNRIKKIDLYNKRIIMNDRTIVDMRNILNINVLK